MRGLLVDVNIQGQMENVRRIYEGTEWSDFWSDLGIEFLQFPDVGLSAPAKDSVIWRTCQREGLVLVTANRNADGPDSLGAMIETENTLTSLPAITVADQEALRVDRQYVHRVAVRILEILYDIDNYRGSGRAFVP
jgi:hypothetical protein